MTRNQRDRLLAHLGMGLITVFVYLNYLTQKYPIFEERLWVEFLAIALFVAFGVILMIGPKEKIESSKESVTAS